MGVCWLLADWKEIFLLDAPLISRLIDFLLVILWFLSAFGWCVWRLRIISFLMMFCWKSVDSSVMNVDFKVLLTSSGLFRKCGECWSSSPNFEVTYSVEGLSSKKLLNTICFGFFHWYFYFFVELISGTICFLRQFVEVIGQNSDDWMSNDPYF